MSEMLSPKLKRIKVLVSLNEDLIKIIDVEAERCDETRSALIRRIIKQYFERETK